MNHIAVLDLGRRPYLATLELQRALVDRRRRGEIDEDLLLLVEHEPVITLGRGTRDSSLPLAPALLRAQGAQVVEVERGGDVTWHGPGQLVGYPIFDLTHHRQDLHWYLRQLEESVIRAMAEFGLAGARVEGKTGVWSGPRKIASIGVHVRQWVTFHGFALNVHPDLRSFDQIVACGIPGVDMTSVERELHLAGQHPGLGRERLWQGVKEAMIRATGTTFERTMGAADPELGILASSVEPSRA